MMTLGGAVKEWFGQWKIVSLLFVGMVWKMVRDSFDGNWTIGL